MLEQISAETEERGDLTRPARMSKSCKVFDSSLYRRLLPPSTAFSSSVTMAVRDSA